MRFEIVRRSSLALLLIPAACAFYACSSDPEEGGGTTEQPDGAVDPVPTVDGSVTPPVGDDDDDDDDDTPADAASDAKKGDGAVYDGATSDASDDANDGATADANDGAVQFDGNFGWPMVDGSTFTLDKNIGAGLFIDGLQWVPAKGYLVYSNHFNATVDTLVPDGGATGTLVTGQGAGPLGSALSPDGGYVFSGIAGKTASGGQTGKIRISPLNGAAASDSPVKRADGTGFNMPNDLIFRSDGLLYTTDPGFYSPAGTTTGVYRHFTDGGTSSTNPTSFAGVQYNGIALSPDETILYVSITDGAFATGRIVKYDVAADGSLGAETAFVTGAAGANALNNVDGLACDDAGNVYVAMANGIKVYDKTAKLLLSLGLPDGNAVSLAFGRADRKTLFISTDNGRIYRIPTNIPGRL